MTNYTGEIMYLSLMPKRILVKEFRVSVHVFSNGFSFLDSRLGNKAGVLNMVITNIFSTFHETKTLHGQAIFGM